MVTLLAIPALHGLFVRTPSPHFRFVVIAGALGLALISLYVQRLGKSSEPGLATAGVWLTRSSAMLILFLTLWNVVYYFVLETTGYTGDIYRRGFQSLHAPVYGRPETAALPGALLSGLVLVFLVGALWARRERLASGHLSSFTMGSAAVAMTLALAASEGLPRVLGRIGHFPSFARDLDTFENIATLIREYVDRMPELGFRNAHYPPGNLMLLKAEQLLGVPGLVMAILLTAMLGTLLLVGLIIQRLGGSQSERVVSQLLFASTPPVLVYTSLDFGPVVMFFSTAALWCAVSAARSFPVRWGLLLGVSLVALTFFSFVSVVVGLMVAAVLVLSWHQRALTFGSAIAVACSAMISALISIGLVWLAGVNLVQCLVQSLDQADTLMMVTTQASPIRYTLRSLANLSAFMYAAFPSATLALRFVGDAGLVRSVRPLAFSFGAAVLGTVVIAAFGGMFFGETERIWLFFTPPLAICAGLVLGRFAGSPSGRHAIVLIVSLGLVLCWSQEIIFRHLR